MRGQWVVLAAVLVAAEASGQAMFGAPNGIRAAQGYRDYAPSEPSPLLKLPEERAAEIRAAEIRAIERKITEIEASTRALQVQDSIRRERPMWETDALIRRVP